MSDYDHTQLFLNKIKKIDKKLLDVKNKRLEMQVFTHDNDFDNYFNIPNQYSTGKMYMLTHKEEKKKYVHRKPYLKFRKQMTPTRAISNTNLDQNSNSIIIKLNRFTKVIAKHNPNIDFLLPFYNKTPFLTEMTSDEVADTIIICEEDIIHKLPEVNLEEAQQFLELIDLIKN